MTIGTRRLGKPNSEKFIFGDNTKLPTEEATIVEIEESQNTTKTDSVKTTEKSALDYPSMRSDSTKTVEKTVVDVTSSPNDSVKTTENQARDIKSVPNDPVKTTGKLADVNPAQSNPAVVADDQIVFDGDKTSSDTTTTYNLDVSDNIYIARPPPIESPPTSPRLPPVVVGYNPRKIGRYNLRPNPKPNAKPDFRMLDAITTTDLCNSE